MRGSAVETTSWSSIAMMSVSSRPGSTMRTSRFGPVGTPAAARRRSLVVRHDKSSLFARMCRTSGMAALSTYLPTG